MHLLVLSVYDLGRQPTTLADAAAHLRTARHRVDTVDVSVEPWPDAALAEVDAVAISVPMHTAARLAADAVRRIRDASPHVAVALFGLYAEMVDPGVTARRIAGEYGKDLVAWADAVATRTAQPTTSRSIARWNHPPPDRTTLPTLDRYPRLEVAGTTRIAGAVEASRGCAHRCLHCPVPVVYDGRIRIVDPDVVLADIDTQVAAGAAHISLTDPDFFNGVHHARRIVDGVAGRHPGLSFDATIKVEHILAHRDQWPAMASAGCLFVISAFETTNDDILRLLDKGHTAAEMAEAVDLLRSHGIEIRPSWLPFTPWTTLDDIVDIFRFIDRHDLVPNTDPVQLSIRLLIPPGSLLLGLDGIDRHLDGYDDAALTFRWRAADPAVDRLAAHLARIATHAADTDTAPEETFVQMWMAVNDATQSLGDPPQLPAVAVTGRPRMQEPWFC